MLISRGGHVVILIFRKKSDINESFIIRKTNTNTTFHKYDLNDANIVPTYEVR
jgi:hypothetical protein